MSDDTIYIQQKMNEILSYAYGVWILTIIGISMIILHIGIGFYFH